MVYCTTTASLMAEDVTVRCLVRKLSSNSVTVDHTTIKIGNSTTDISTPAIVEMTCTMRNWDTNYYGKSSSNRSASTGRNNHQHQQSSSRNMMLQNDFSMYNPDLRMDANNTILPSSLSKRFHSDSAIDIAATNNDHNNNNQHDRGGPELLFTPTYDLSPSKSNRIYSSRRISPVSLQPYSIPVEEILLVTYDIANSCDHNPSYTKLHITTISLGQYDVDCVTLNGHDVVLAFLQASLPQVRIVRDETKDCSQSTSRTSPNGARHRSRHQSRKKSASATNCSGHKNGELLNVQSTDSSVNSSCYDIDALQAKHLAGRAEAETWSEKIQRRYGHVVANILEQLDTCCNNTTITTTTEVAAQQHSYQEGTVSGTMISTKHENRSSPMYESPTVTAATITAVSQQKSPNATTTTAATPRRSVHTTTITGCLYGELEIDDNATDCSLRDRSPPPLLRRPQPLQEQTLSKETYHLLPPIHNNNISHPSNEGELVQQRNNHHHSNEQQQQEHVRIDHMPSGLSVEPEHYDMESMR